MEIYCKKCDKVLGHYPDEKIPLNVKGHTACNLCGSRIEIFRTSEEVPASKSTEVTALSSKPSSSPLDEIEQTLPLLSGKKDRGIKSTDFIGLAFGLLTLFAIIFSYKPNFDVSKLLPETLQGELMQQMMKNQGCKPDDCPDEFTDLKEPGEFMPDGTRIINISISSGDFRAVEMVAPARHDPDYTINLLKNNPDKKVKLPKFQGEKQYFGYLKLGAERKIELPFVIDLYKAGQTRCYLDTNQNMDLTEKSDMFVSKGKGLFAFEIKIPFKYLVNNDEFAEEYKLWLFTNSSLWKKKQARFYSRTQFKGSADLGDIMYDAYIVDSGRNDADFTNDGICLDMDYNKKIQLNSECFSSDVPVNIGDKKYIFIIDG